MKADQLKALMDWIDTRIESELENDDAEFPSSASIQKHARQRLYEAFDLQEGPSGEPLEKHPEA